MKSHGFGRLLSKLASIVCNGWRAYLANIQQEYGSNVAFVFPSLHDSGGMVVLESLAAGLPVICLKLGGPGEIVTPSCGIGIEAQQQSEEAIIRLLADAMISIATDRSYGIFSKNAAARQEGN